VALRLNWGNLSPTVSIEELLAGGRRGRVAPGSLPGDEDEVWSSRRDAASRLF